MGVKDELAVQEEANTVEDLIYLAIPLDNREGHSKRAGRRDFTAGQVQTPLTTIVTAPVPTTTPPSRQVELMHIMHIKPGCPHSNVIYCPAKTSIFGSSVDNVVIS